jgi:phenylacetate-CoA ligase
MEHSAYWNPKNETLPRAQLQALQFLKLRRLCEWAWARSAFHRRLWEKGHFHPDQLKTLDDIRRIPFTTREDWMDAQVEKPAFGDLTTVDHRLAIRYHLTSGTSGRVPIRVLDGRKDWEWIAEMWAYGFWGFGVRPGDRVFFAFSYGTFIGFWGAQRARWGSTSRRRAKSSG